MHSKVFLVYICNNVLPGLQQMTSPEEGVDIKLDILKLLAEISEYNGLTQDEAAKPLANVFNTLIVSTLIVY